MYVTSPMTSRVAHHVTSRAHRGYPEEECLVLLDTECGSVVRARREAALKLLEDASKYLDWQVRRTGQRSGAAALIALLALCLIKSIPPVMHLTSLTLTHLMCHLQGSQWSDFWCAVGKWLAALLELYPHPTRCVSDFTHTHAHFTYLCLQGSEWSDFSGAVGKWLGALLELYHGYKTKTGNNEAEVGHIGGLMIA